MKDQEIKDSNNRRKLVLSVILIIILIISITSITYALFTYSKEGKIRNTITTGSISFNYTETTNGISLENAMPISDTVGKNLNRSQNNEGYFDFNVSSSIAGTGRIQYEVYATKEKVENELSEKYVKIYLTDRTTDRPISGYDMDVPTYDSLKNSISKKGSKQLYYGTFVNSGVQSFRLRMWVSDQYNIPSSSQQFKIKVGVDATN